VLPEGSVGGGGEWKKPKNPLKSFNKPSSSNIITSVAWSSSSSSSSSSRQGPRDCLVGTSQGQIHYLSLQASEDLFKSQEREFTTVWTFGGEKSAVVGLGWGGGGKERAWLVAVQRNGKGWEGSVAGTGGSGKGGEELSKGLKEGGGLSEFEANASRFDGSFFVD